MYSPFLWRNAKGQSQIIKRRWRRRSSQMLQICSQSTKLIKHVHQKLSMSHLNGHDNIQHTSMSESYEVGGGGTSTASALAAWSTSSSVVASPVEEGGGGATLEGSSLGHLELALKWAALYLRKMAPMRAIMCTGSDTGNSTKPRCKRIQWIKTGKNKAWAVELLLCTSIKERMKRWGKLIEASVIRAYKNAQRSNGMVCRWEIGQNEWQAILKKI